MRGPRRMGPPVKPEDDEVESAEDDEVESADNDEIESAVNDEIKSAEGDEIGRAEHGEAGRCATRSIGKFLPECAAAVLLGMAITTLVPPAQASEAPPPEDEIIIIGSRTPIPRAEVTAAVSVIDAPDMQSLGDVFAADALRDVPGVSVNRSGPAGALTQVRLRGAEANHVLVLIDGIEASNPFTGSFNFSAMPAYGLSKIEVLRGEQSALWGSDAIGGVINLVTTPAARGNSASAYGEAGSFHTVRSGARAQGVFGEARAFGSLDYADSRGYDVSGTGGDKDGYDNVTALGGFDAPLGHVAKLKTRARFVRAHSQFDADTNFDGRLDDAPLRLRSSQFDSLAELSADSLNGHLRHQLKATYTTTEDVSGTSRSDGFRTQVSVQESANWQTGKLAHHLTVLGEVEREIYKNNGGPGAGQNQKRHNTMTALAADYRLVSGDLVLSASGRRDAHSLFANTNTWRVGAAYKVAPLGGRLRLSAGQGIKNPGFFELFGFFPAFFTGNPDLKAERSTGYELGWEQTIGPARLSISAYSSRLKNEIFTDFGSFPATARNRTGKSRRRGVEIEGDWTVSPALRLTGSATFAHSAQGGVREIRRPNFLAAGALHWQPAGAIWGLDLGADHNGAMKDTDFGTFSPVRLKAYTLIHGTAHFDLGQNMQVYVRAENLLDERYSEVFGFAGQGRGIYGGVRAKF